jgi:crotonobetaine/carnitine-CoA ligase
MQTLDQIKARLRAVETVPLPECVGDLLNGAAAKFAERECFNFFEQGVSLTYADVRNQVHRLADSLHRIGVCKGTHVAVMLPNLPAYPITWLALATLGAVMVPVNNRYTARELTYIVSNADASFLVLHADYFDIFDGVDHEAFPVAGDCVISVGDRRPGSPHHWPDLVAAGDADFEAPEPVTAEDLLNIQYTSGTTGFPKGCMQTHRYWIEVGACSVALADFTIKRILCAQYFYYLDPQIFVVTAFNQGGAVYFADRLRASKFMHWVREHDIDFIYLFEPIFKQTPHPDDGNNKLKLICVFGLTPQNHAPLEARFQATAREWYGMTEIGGALYVPAEIDHMTGSGSCGIPAPFHEVSIRNPQTGDPVTRGDAGELWVRGPGIMKGYYKQPEANAECFVDDWFRTGDLFRCDDQGFHYIVGRVKDMIRRSAENIAAREVEAVLRTHSDIKEAAVVPVPDDYRGEEVKAYVQLADGKTREDLTPEAIFDHCARDLAAFKVPRYIEYRSGFTFGPSDRVEKHKLTANVTDLRFNSFDRVDNCWR